MDDAVQRRFQLGIVVCKIVPRVSVDVVALHNGVDMGLDVARKDAPIILPRLHHDREIGKLCCPVVYVQTVEVVLQNALSCVPFTDTILFVNLD